MCVTTDTLLNKNIAFTCSNNDTTEEAYKEIKVKYVCEESAASFLYAIRIIVSRLSTDE